MITPRVELHVHLDGAIKHETAWELLNKKNLPLPGDGSYQAFLNAILVKEPSTLMNFLRGFGVFLPAVIGDIDAIERMAFEFCEYQSKEGVIYAEARYCPHLLLPESFTEANFLNHTSANVQGLAQITTVDIVNAVIKGFKKGEENFGIIVRSILSCIRGKPEWSQEILDLCIQFKDKGVVGIDIAGDEGGEHPINEEESEHRMLDKEDVEVFTKAKELGIHRTVHAGEAGPAAMVKKALEILHAERIGHGYRVLEDKAIYLACLKNGVHFECCPTSSLLTGSVSLDVYKDHPIVQFSRDGASFSVNTDDPTVTNTKLSDEYGLVRKWGLSEEQIKQSNIEAIKHSFAEPEIKKAILEKLMKAYGMS